MRTKHTSHPLPAFPVYSSAFLSPNELVLGGGGGQSRSGIKNKLRLYRVDNDKSLDLLDELELDTGEDAPMSMAAHTPTAAFVCGVNSAAQKLQEGDNQNCRTYAVGDHKISSVRTQSTLSLKGTEDDYQRVTVFSPNGNFLAVAGTSDVALLNYPSLSFAASPVRLQKGEIYDATFSDKKLVVATTVNLLVYALPSSEVTEKSDKASGKQKESPLPDLELLKTVERPTLPGKDAGSSFRAARYHPHDEKIFYTIMNTVPARTRAKSSPRRAFVCKWDAETWEVTKVRKVGDRGLTCFDVSPNGKLLAFGSSDYTVGILDAHTLAPLLTILKAHEFPPTTLHFNTTSNLLVSGSADNTVRVVTVPESLGATSWSSWILIIITLFIILLAIITQQMH
ncbi:WD40 repeat-like protein [Amylocystis lapponica]|nr:WD40 repeat-like protein [Amylocystis lapponica]